MAATTATSNDDVDLQNSAHLREAPDAQRAENLNEFIETLTDDELWKICERLHEGGPSLSLFLSSLSSPGDVSGSLYLKEVGTSDCSRRRGVSDRRAGHQRRPGVPEDDVQG